MKWSKVAKWARRAVAAGNAVPAPGLDLQAVVGQLITEHKELEEEHNALAVDVGTLATVQQRLLLAHELRIPRAEQEAEDMAELRRTVETLRDLVDSQLVPDNEPSA